MAKGAKQIAADIERELRAAGQPARAVQEKRYLKSDRVHLGVGAPNTRRISKASFRQDIGDRAILLATIEMLWASDIFEMKAVAVEMLMLGDDLLLAADIRLVERFILDGKTWAIVDALAVAVAGGLVERFDSARDRLDAWSRHKDFWLRRASMLALLRPLRKGEGDWARFVGYADAMLEEREFFIRKAIGWVLREVSKKRPRLVADWIEPRAARASGVTLREARKYLKTPPAPRRR
jgi:3-methyladenine DNA glycosylase AlkD